MICPKCGSNECHTDKRGYSATKGVLGIVMTGGVGLLGGFIGARKVDITCLCCGHRFKPGEGGVYIPKVKPINQIDTALNQVNPLPIAEEKSIWQKMDENRLSHTESRGVKKPIARTTIKPSPMRFDRKVVCKCGSMNEMHAKFCRVCGVKIDFTSMATIKNGQLFEHLECPFCHSKTPKPSNKCMFCTNCGAGISK